MPVDITRYPKNWAEISRGIKERDGWKCKWCGAPHNALIVRDGGAWRVVEMSQVDALELDGFKVVRVILTTAHLGAAHIDGTPGDKHDKMDVRDENLAALCQRCHLLYDIDEHIKNASTTRTRKAKDAARDAGQIELF